MRIDKETRPLFYDLGALLIGTILFSSIYIYFIKEFSGCISFMFSFSILSIFNYLYNYFSISISKITGPRPYVLGIPAVFVIQFVIGCLLCISLRNIIALPLNKSIIITGVILSISDLISQRIWVFTSPLVGKIQYKELSGEFYEESTEEENVGKFRSWYHSGRYLELQKIVHSIYEVGQIIYDFGCGGSEWNKNSVPVTGIDVNEDLLQHGKKRGQIQDIVVATLDHTELPGNSADIVIISEVIEHIVNPNAVLHEIYRCLKKGGSLVLTVPWDTPFSLFYWLFNFQCFYRGYLLGEAYYRQRCGHVNHFSSRKLRKLLEQNGFRTKKLYRFRGLLLYSISEK